MPPTRHRSPLLRCTVAVAGLLAAALAPVGLAQAEPAPPVAASADPPAESRDVALDGTASAASVYTGDLQRFAAENVNDGDLATRWGSDYAREGVLDPPPSSHDPSNDWVQVELAEPSPVDHVVLHWEAAYAAEYRIDVSDDGRTWTTALEVTDGAGGREVLDLGLDDPVKFVRMQGVRVATGWGYSLWSLEVWDGPAPGAGPGGRILPVPVSQTPGEGAPYELTEDARVVAPAGEAQRVAELLAADLRPATGFELPVTTGPAEAGDIELVLGPDEAPGGPEAAEEGYTLAVDEDAVRIGAATAHGLFNGTQTLRQLLPPWIYGDVERPGPWQVEAVEVSDHPRFVHRGLMIDPARNFIEVEEVKKIIDDLVATKGNVLHIHLTDDQGWRLEIKGWPRLTEVGGAMSMPGGRSGFYTQEQFTEIVQYANARFVEVVPEIDMPAHATAAVTAYPELTCGGNMFCPSNERTFEFIDDVMGELAAISPNKYVHIGADEAPMARDDYVSFVRRAEDIVQSHGKTMIGWSPAPGTGLDPESVHHYWQDQSREMEESWFAPRRPVILSPTQQLYLDYPYPSYNTRRAYSWDPLDITDGWTGEKLNDHGFNPDDILGMEAPIWGEQLRNGLPDIQYRIFPRLPAIMEKAWSPAESTVDAGPMLGRMQKQGARWLFGGTRFYVDPEVAWEPAAAGTVMTQDSRASVSGDVAHLAIPGAAPSSLTATIDWGDGTSSTGEVTGAAGTLLAVRGSHTYPRLGDHTGTVTVTGPRGLELTAPFEAGPVPLRAALGEVSEYVEDGLARLEVELFNSTDRPILATVTPETPDGVVAHPGARPVAVPAGAVRTVRFELESHAEPGTLQIPVRVAASSAGEALRIPVLTASVEQPFRDLAAALDGHGITSDADPGPTWLGGGIDGDGSSFSKEALAEQGAVAGASVVRDGFTFTWPGHADGRPDHVVADGQLVEVQGAGSELGFLLTGAYAPVSGTGQVHYADGTTQDFRLETPDWHQSPEGVEVAFATSYNNFRDGSRVERPANIFLQTVPLDPGRTVERVVLPRSEQGGRFLHRLFALA
ncbi:MAG TPA: family 20 glycosylhydrolase, partial [Nocardioides sp.]|nr:family 20 glycosylhydrolase [Nocardioides sp.]